MVKEGIMQNSAQPLENNDDNDKVDWYGSDDWSSNKAEYEDIHEKLDDLHFVLDFLEKKNRTIQAELMELLQSNREARKQFQEALNIKYNRYLNDTEKK
ncbi:bublin coiled-coil protein-like [Polistes fuscatus]|uniref:bublin coiled-coil protein-like n=1 Tax=Polistes fuscatus TaxID=30207 RepID=UPI001CA9D3E9|nr:bublin coiled-coil protein-like [Polistes fuscatus]